MRSNGFGRRLNVLLATLNLIIGFLIANKVNQIIRCAGTKYAKLDDTLFRFLGSVTKLTLPLWKAFWIYSIPLSLVYQLLWGQVFVYLPSSDWTPEAYKALLIFKHSSEVLIYGFIIYLLAKLTFGASRLAIIASRGFFLVLILVTFKALLVNIGIVQ
ncbi:MAG: hypothetical protein ACI82A_003878 [Candidatus Azotimanducaceae bacterium]